MTEQMEHRRGIRKLTNRAVVTAARLLNGNTVASPFLQRKKNSDQAIEKNFGWNIAVQISNKSIYTDLSRLGS